MITILKDKFGSEGFLLRNSPPHPLRALERDGAGINYY